MNHFSFDKKLETYAVRTVWFGLDKQERSNTTEVQIFMKQVGWQPNKDKQESKMICKDLKWATQIDRSHLSL